mgnify:CR=1 FL=1
MDGERRAHMNEVHILGCTRQPADEHSEWAIPVWRWRIFIICSSEHLELLTLNTLYMK